MSARFYTLMLGVLMTGTLLSQTIVNPNYGLKSHETLEIQSVVMNSNSTTLNMAIENRSLDGTFCADKDIYIYLPGGKRLKIKSAEGIPRCPETHVFTSFGERLNFSLTFPLIPEGTRWFDLVEDCEDNCFSFTGVILDPALNKEIDNAYSLEIAGKYQEASTEFEKLLPGLSGTGSSYEGAVYWNLIHLAKLSGNKNKTDEWTQKLINSDVVLKEKYLENLKGF
jgi:hypothetical protein